MESSWLALDCNCPMFFYNVVVSCIGARKDVTDVPALFLDNLLQNPCFGGQVQNDTIRLRR